MAPMVELTLQPESKRASDGACCLQYYRGASAALLVYDVTSANSLEEAKSWAAELQRNTDDDTRMLAWQALS